MEVPNLTAKRATLTAPLPCTSSADCLILYEAPSHSPLRIFRLILYDDVTLSPYSSVFEQPFSGFLTQVDLNWKCSLAPARFLLQDDRAFTRKPYEYHSSTELRLVFYGSWVEKKASSVTRSLSIMYIHFLLSFGFAITVLH